MIILAGDIGATKTHLAVYRPADSDLKRERDQIYPTQEFPSLEIVLGDFIEGQAITVACLGVPGPVTDGLARPTNIAWEIREESLSRTLDGASTRLVNDLAATAHG
ncbi:MAG: glucokinase, partial [Deltaproteobacteria bacterium]|nr:glucokinase [Deltaproteobacteria bacterium]